MTLRTIVTRSLAKGAFVLACLGIVLAFANAYPGRSVAGEAASRPAAPGTPEYLIALHDCYDGSAARSAVVTLPEAVAPVWTGDLPPKCAARLLHLAADQAFYGHDHGLTVAAFCDEAMGGVR